MEKRLISKGSGGLARHDQVGREVSDGIEDKLKRLLVLDAAKRTKEFLFFGCLYATGALAMLLSAGNFAAMAIGILFMGCAFNSLPIFIHEGLHGLLAKRWWLNHLLTFMVGLPLMMSATAYYTTHVDHHHELGRKPDYGTYRQHTGYPVLIWVAYFLQLAFGSFIYVALIPLLGFKAASRRSRMVIIAEYGVIGTLATLFFKHAPTDTILHYWFYPMLLMNVLTNIRGVASHALGDPENIYLSSRTIKGSKLVSILFLNENYHLEHHLFPRTPSYNLPAMHSLIWMRLPKAIYSESYLHFLFGLVKAALKKDLNPMGVVNPKPSA